MPARLFHRHRVRATFYHVMAFLYLVVAGLQEGGVINVKLAFWLGLIIFVLDYLAEMYDPHPETPGPWFRSHFHRFFDDDKDLDGDGTPDV